MYGNYLYWKYYNFIIKYFIIDFTKIIYNSVIRTSLFCTWLKRHVSHWTEQSHSVLPCALWLHTPL